MGRVIRAQRRGATKGVKGRTSTTCRAGPAQLRKLDYAEREGYLRGVVTDLMHDPGRGAPVMKVRFKAVYHNRKDDEIIVAPGEFSSSRLQRVPTRAPPCASACLDAAACGDFILSVRRSSPKCFGASSLAHALKLERRAHSRPHAGASTRTMADLFCAVLIEAGCI